MSLLAEVGTHGKDRAVAKRRGPSLRARWLGEQLRDLRESAGLTLKQAADYLQKDPSMVSRFESAEYPIRRGDVLALIDLYEVSEGGRRQGLLRLSEDVWQKGWWDGYADVVERQFIDHPWLEARADRIHSYNAMILPGLLQIREYAEALIRAAEGPSASDDQINRLVELRMTRQQVLAGDQATGVTAILDESVLRRVIGGEPVMRQQLDHLLTLLGNPRVDVRILQLSVGVHTGLDGTFILFEMPEPYSDVAYVENLAGRVYVETPHVELFQRAYDRLSEVALERDASAELISATLEELT